MDPLNQPGSLGFAYVPFSAGDIDDANVVVTGIISGVSKTATGRYAFTVNDTDIWPVGFGINPTSDDCIIGQLRGNPVRGDATFEIRCYDAAGALVNPLTLFITLLPT